LKSQAITMRYDRTWIPTVFLAMMLALMLGYASRAYAAPGDFDASFDGDGQVTTDFGSVDTAQDVAVLENGKIVVAGYTSAGGTNDFALARYNPDGSLDTSFGSGGKVITPIGSSSDYARALAIQPDGKIVVAGSSYNGTTYDFAVARYQPGGSLDGSFDGDGKVITSILSGLSDRSDEAYDLALQPDGKIVVAGETGTNYNGLSNSGKDFALVRYNIDGSLDTNADADPATSFDADGRRIFNVAPGNDGIHGVAIQPDGKIVAAGYTSSGEKPSDFALVRLNPDGSSDTAFDGDGKAITDFFSDSTTYYADGANDVAIQEDGRIVVAGYASGYSIRYFALARYNPNGSLNTSFGHAGKTYFYNSARFNEAQAVAVQEDGGILMAGYVGEQSGGGTGSGDYLDFQLVSMRPDGNYGTAWPQIDLGSTDDQAFGLALQEDGRSVVVGQARGSTNSLDFALVRQHWSADATPPRVRPPEQSIVAGSALGSSDVPVRFSWSATDAEGEISSYQLQQSVNGAAYENVALPYDTATSVQPSLAFDSSYRYRVRATDDNGNRSVWKYGPRFVVDDRQENESGVGYPKGIWKTQELNGAHGGQVKYATTRGATATFSFSGRSVAWVAPKSSTRGKASVYLDGVKVTTVDLYSRSTLSRQVVFSRDDLDPTVNHKLEVVVMGTSGRLRVDVDALVALR
jgi:uncharacterized delta-60 repeat protein